ncbi:hypothetical protein ABPG75_003936 [Micractinium tetrahymenae]
MPNRPSRKLNRRTLLFCSLLLLINAAAESSEWMDHSPPRWGSRRQRSERPRPAQAHDAARDGGGAPADVQLSTQEERRQGRLARRAALAARTAARDAEQQAREEASQEQHARRSAAARALTASQRRQTRREQQAAEKQRLAAVLHCGARRWPPDPDLIKQLPGERIYQSADSVKDPEHATLYPVEFLNTLATAGLPPHELRLKPGVPIMPLRKR